MPNDLPSNRSKMQTASEKSALLLNYSMQRRTPGQWAWSPKTDENTDRQLSRKSLMYTHSSQNSRKRLKTLQSRESKRFWCRTLKVKQRDMTTSLIFCVMTRKEVEPKVERAQCLATLKIPASFRSFHKAVNWHLMTSIDCSCSRRKTRRSIYSSAKANCFKSRRKQKTARSSQGFRIISTNIGFNRGILAQWAHELH